MRLVRYPCTGESGWAEADHRLSLTRTRVLAALRCLRWLASTHTIGVHYKG